MFKKYGVAALLAALLVTLAGSPAQAYAPQEGGSFNNPWGTDGAKERLLNKIQTAIRNTPRGATIRAAAYSNDRKDITDALIRAKRRGVNVQVLLNDNWTSFQTKRLIKAFGSNVSKKSFTRICKGSCRGRKGNLHSKFYLFSKTGSAEHVVMFGSANLTGFGAKTQWNDLYTSNNRQVLHSVFRNVFDEMKQDKIRAHPFVSKSVGDFDLNFYPRYDTTASDDPMMNTLRRVRCNGASGATGVGDHTMIRVNMYGWNGTRGIYLAKKVADLSRRGCDVRVIESSAGGRVVRILANNGVQIKTADRDRNNNGTTDVFTHAKWMIISGNYAQKAGWHVWTGSQNWSDRSLNGDEVTVHIPRRGAFGDYQDNFSSVWRTHASWVGGTKPTASAARTTAPNAGTLATRLLGLGAGT